MFYMFARDDLKKVPVSPQDPLPVIGVSGGTTAVTVANGADVTQGAVADAAVTNPASSGSVIAFLKGILTQLQALITVGGTQVFLTATPTVTAGAYTTGQVVGGLVSLSGAARVNAGSGLIQSVLVTVKTALTAPFDVIFFSTNPTNSTFTDNAALAINVADLQSVCGVAHCNEVVSGGTPQILQGPNLALPFKLSAAATILYAVIVMRGGETFASTSAIGLNVNILQN